MRFGGGGFFSAASFAARRDSRSDVERSLRNAEEATEVAGDEMLVGRQLRPDDGGVKVDDGVDE